MEESVRGFSPLQLAFLGDAVFELLIRERVMLMKPGSGSVKSLNTKKARIVNAHAQAELARRIAGRLTDEEADILRRGRNAHPATIAKNQSVADYRLATGLEALCGYLYLTGRTQRLRELLEAGEGDGNEKMTLEAAGEEETHGEQS